MAVSPTPAPTALADIAPYFERAAAGYMSALNATDPGALIRPVHKLVDVANTDMCAGVRLLEATVGSEDKLAARMEYDAFTGIMRELILNQNCGPKNDRTFTPRAAIEMRERLLDLSNSASKGATQLLKRSS
jgi:hypothetical protein